MALTQSTDIELLRENFSHLLFERIDRTKNEYRFYYLSWQPTLFDEHAVVRIAGRNVDGRCRVMAPVPFDSFDEAWPYIRSIIRKRLRNGYRIVL